MLLAAILPVVLGLAGNATSWLFKAVLGLFCAAALAIYSHRFLADKPHDRDQRDVHKANEKLVQLYAGIRPTHKQPMEIYAQAAESKGILPIEVDPNNHVLDRDYVPSRATHAPPLAQSATDHQQLKVTNNVDIVLELTCQQLPTFGCFLKQGQTVELPTTIKSPATIIAQGYFEDHSVVKLVNQFDVDIVSCVCIDENNGVVRMDACANC